MPVAGAALLTQCGRYGTGLPMSRIWVFVLVSGFPMLDA